MRKKTNRDILFLFNAEANKKNPDKAKLGRLAKQYASSKDVTDAMLSELAETLSVNKYTYKQGLDNASKATPESEAKEAKEDKELLEKAVPGGFRGLLSRILNKDNDGES